MSLSVGSVIAFAGENYLSINGKGWALCDGGLLGREQYPELFRAIGTANGAPNDQTFALPDLKGYFIRGVSGNSGNDPGAEQRTEPQSGANAGNKVGSRQDFSTGAPTGPDRAFKGSIPNLPIDDVQGNYGSLLGSQYTLWNPNTLNFDIGGGDAETRPKNKYVYFMIKTSSEFEGKPVELPIGAVLPFASTNSEELFDEWLMCDGNQYSNLNIYKKLFEVIGTSNGGDGNPYFKVPDFQGFFLRGVALGSTVDPDRTKRLPPAVGGNDGDRVGSRQDDATAKPKETAFRIGAPHLPEQSTKVDKIHGRNAGEATDAWRAVSFSGGDDETRPINITVDWYIKFRNVA